MAIVTINDNYLNNIASAIRFKNGTTNTYKPREMASAIRAISTSSTAVNADVKAFIERNFTGAITADCSVVGNYAFATMNSMTAVTCTALRVNDYGFYKCQNLGSVYMPNLTHVGQFAFSDCTGLTDVSIPKVKVINNFAFNYCTSLTKIDLGSNIEELYGQIFDDCDQLTAVIIRTNYVPDCVEGSSPIPGRFDNDYDGDNPGYIYVPKAMIASYQRYTSNMSTNKYDYWSNRNYRAIEDYPEICG